MRYALADMPSPSPRRRGLLTALSSLLVAGLSSCSGGPQLIQGECRPVHGSDICVWAEMNGSTPLSFGATVPIGAIERAPADAPMVWPPVAAATIPVPAALTQATTIETVTVFWEPHGHPPGPYLAPHFDFHFNTLSAAGLDAIDCADATKPATLPAAYAMADIDAPAPIGKLVGLCVPKMGMHSMPDAELQAGRVFEKTMIVGYYKTKPIFIEPMITRATLLERKGFSIAVPDVPGKPANARYPTQFRADYDQPAQSYRLVFSELR
jgi:hypothetical protein